MPPVSGGFHGRCAGGTPDDERTALSPLNGSLTESRPPAAEGTPARRRLMAAGPQPGELIAAHRRRWGLWIGGRWRSLSQTHLGVRPRTRSRPRGVTGGGQPPSAADDARVRARVPRALLWRSRPGEFSGGNWMALRDAGGTPPAAWPAPGALTWAAPTAN